MTKTGSLTDHAASDDSLGERGQGSPAYRLLVLILMVLVYTISYMDRIVGSVVAPPIQGDLGLSDAQIGMINGAAFSIPFVICSFALGWVADRKTRTRMIAGSIALWSIGTACMGLGENFWHLASARFAVGVGEGGFYGASVSLLIDYFPKRQLGRVMAALGFGVPIGTATGLALGGYLTETFGWREALIIFGGFGLLVGAVIFLCLREPRRQRYDAAPGLFGSLKALFLNSNYMMVNAACAVGGIASFGKFFWLPSMFLRSYSVGLAEFAAMFGTIQLVGGVSGAWLGGFVSDRLGQKGVREPYLLVASLGYFAAGLAFFALLLTENVVVSLAFLSFATVVQAMGHGPILVSYQAAIKPQYRAMASGLVGSTLITVAMGAGLPLLGLLSDSLKARYGADSLHMAMLTLPMFYSLAAIMFFIEGKRRQNKGLLHV